MITAATVPGAINARIGRKLHHSEGNGCSGKSMSVSAGANERVDERGVVGLRKCRMTNAE